jgi:hypothetical protein
MTRHLHTNKLWRFPTSSGRESIGCLIPNLFFGHNLCFKYPNGSCELILNIYIPKYFQWSKEIFNIMIFGPYNRPLKIQESWWTLTPTFSKSQSGSSLWSVGVSFLHILLHSRENEGCLLGFTFGPYLCKPLAWLRAQS